MDSGGKRSLLCVRRSTSGKGVAGLIAPKPCGFLNMLDKGIPLWKARNFPRSRGRSQVAKRRMREIRPSGDRRRGPLLNSGAALRRQPRSVLVDVLSPTARRTALAAHFTEWVEY